MANIISDETIEYVGILAKLELSEEEKEQAKKDMGSMLDYIDKLNELDTTGVEPMSHVFPVDNVFREDVVTNGDDRDEMLANAPQKKDGTYMVPKTSHKEGNYGFDEIYCRRSWKEDQSRRSDGKRSSAGCLRPDKEIRRNIKQLCDSIGRK